jgi:hypothetical protein
MKEIRNRSKLKNIVLLLFLSQIAPVVNGSVIK